MGRNLLSFAVGVLNALPHRAALRLGAFLGTLLWLFARRKVDRAESRCVAALGMGVTLSRRVVRKSYANMGRSAVEFARMKRLFPQLDSWVSVEGKEHLDEALSRGKGALLMTAHMGNWELAGARLGTAGYSLTVVYTPQKNKAGVNDWLSAQRAGVMDSIPSAGFGLRGAFRVLREGGVLIIMQDLDARKEGVPVPFLGLPSSSATGIVKWHRKFGAPVVPAVALRSSDGVHHTVRIEKILSDFADEDGNPFGINMEKSLKMCNNTLERWIKDFPEQWMWLPDKWGSTLGKQITGF